MYTPENILGHANVVMGDIHTDFLKTQTGKPIDLPGLREVINNTADSICRDFWNENIIDFSGSDMEDLDDLHNAIHEAACEYHKIKAPL